MENRHGLPELLAPAGNWECARAAVANGADAIYFGMPQFNARLRADNFQEADLPELMRFLHGHGVRGLVAFNTLVFTHELEAAEQQLLLLQETGVDAIIVQDLGLARVARRVAPDVEIHASTQMTITSPEGLEFASQLGLDQAVLARELSLRELERFRGSPVPLEVFVHGALCVAYSGQCLTSESLGQRSANRGECAQACRMPYQLVVDGQWRDLGEKAYLLSPQDLAAIDDIPQLMELGIRCFKIEGRLKSPEYVAAVTRAYRGAIDAAADAALAKPGREARYELEMTFSRGLFSGWLHGVDHQQLVGARYGKKRGPFVGKVVSVRNEVAELDTFAVGLQPGDGVVFDTGEDTDQEQGGFLFQVEGRRIALQRGKIDWSRVGAGARVWKTSDPALEKRLRSTFKGTPPVRKRAGLVLEAAGAVGGPLVITAQDASGNLLATVTSAMVLEKAVQRPLTKEVLVEQLGRLGGTIWELAKLETKISGDVILPVSELNRLRRAMLEQLAARKKERCRGTEGVMASELSAIAESRREAPILPEPILSVLCRSDAQVEAALSMGVARLMVDFEDIRLYAGAVEKVRERAPESEIFLASPRIQKPAEAGFFKSMARANPHGILVRNLGGIAFFREEGLPMVGDFSLNCANPLTAKFLMEQGFEYLTISYDLNCEQVMDLLRAAPPGWFELTLHQHMPMFHMEHCVFAAFMSEGKDFLTCGRPCDRHRVHLRDRVGMEHPLRADVGCRNTLFNAVAQTGARFYAQLSSAGLRRFRVELLEEDGAATEKVIRTYQDLLAGKADGAHLWRQLQAQSKLGVTTGTLREP